METLSHTPKAVSFTQLTVWKEGHVLVMLVYKLTKKFPKDELFGLTSQMRRAAVSVTSNIAEGFGRPSKPDKIHFYYISLSSIYELQNQSLIARDNDYMQQKDFIDLANQSVKVAKMLQAFIRSIKIPKLPATNY